MHFATLALASGADCTQCRFCEAVFHGHSPIPSMVWPALWTDRLPTAVGTMAGLLPEGRRGYLLYAGVLDGCRPQRSLRWTSPRTGGGSLGGFTDAGRDGVGEV